MSEMGIKHFAKTKPNGTHGPSGYRFVDHLPDTVAEAKKSHA
jgi:hypothetical protein